MKSEQKVNHPPQGVPPFLELSDARPGTGMEPYVLIVRAGREMICKHHLRWGHPRSAGPRQEEGAGSREVGIRMWPGWG
jgi:hypothetical protein